MSSTQDIEPFSAPIAALNRVLTRFDDKGMIIGSVAASLLGTPRVTADVGALILLPLEDLPELVEAAEQEGMELRIDDAEAFARQHRVLLLRHTASGINVDIWLGMLPFEEETVAQSTVHQIGDLKLRLPTPEDLIVFKTVAHRPQDLLDIRGLIEANPSLERERIEHWVVQFARAQDMPELWEDIEPWLPQD